MKFNILHLTMCNRIINNLDCNLIVTMKNNQGFNKKPEVTKELSDTNNLNPNINKTTILYFNCEQRDTLLFHRGQYKGHITEEKRKLEVDFRSSPSLDQSRLVYPTNELLLQLYLIPK